MPWYFAKTQPLVGIHFAQWPQILVNYILIISHHNRGRILIIDVVSSRKFQQWKLILLALLAHVDFAGDLSLALDPHPPPETPTTSDALDLSVLSPEHGDQSEETIPTSAEDMIAPPHPVQMPSIPSALKDVTNITKSKKTPGKDWGIWIFNWLVPGEMTPMLKK